MKRYGSINASDIIADWQREKYLKSLYESRLRQVQRDKENKEEQNSIK